MSEDNLRVEREETMVLFSFGPFPLMPVIADRAFALLWELRESVRCTVTTDEDEAEVGLEP